MGSCTNATIRIRKIKNRLVKSFLISKLWTMFEAVLFDNDGILINTERVYVRACQEVVREMFDWSLDLQTYQQYGYTLGIGTTGWLLEKGVSKENGERFQTQRDALYSEFLSQKIVPMKGVMNLLRYLQEKHIPRALVTATRREHLELSHSQTGILDFFDFIVTLEDVAQSKPSPEGYLLAAQKLNVSPEKCLVIEDSPRGMVAGKTAGMTVWAVPTDQTRDLDLSNADAVFESLEDVLERLQD